MPKSLFVDFKAVKAAITMEQVLEHYSLLSKLKRSGDSLSGPCPIHKGNNPTQFRVSLSKNVWNCFSECKHGGNTLDFVARMENVSVHSAALKVIQWFGLKLSVDSSDSKDRMLEKTEGDTSKRSKSADVKVAEKTEDNTPNPPLKFRLDKLKREHPYLTKERGLTLETIVDFGLGYFTADKGLMVGRIVIPIHNAKGELVAYAGRWPGEPPEDTEKYKLPPKFKKLQELFNFDRAIKEPADKPLVIVEGFFDVIKLHQHGYRKTVALMGSFVSPAHVELIRLHTTPQSQIVLMLDEDKGGQDERDRTAAQLSKLCFVRTIQFSQPGTQPEHLGADELSELFE
jgi:DNA primase